MAVHFRAVFPYTLSGVLAIIGWWWFFSRKKNRRDNQPERPIIASGKDECEENIQKDILLADKVISLTVPVTQRNKEEIAENCISHSTSSHFGTFSESPAFEKVETSRESKIGDKDLLTTQHLENNHLSRVNAVLEGESYSQETPISNQLECSSFESTPTLYFGANEIFDKICKDLENVVVEIEYPEDNLSTGLVPTVENEVVEKNDIVAVLEEKVGSCAENKALLSMARDATAVVLKDPKKSETFVLEVEEVEPSKYTDTLPQEHEAQRGVEKVMASSTETMEIASSVGVIEAIIEENAFQHIDFRKSVSTDVTHPDVLKAEVEIEYPEDDHMDTGLVPTVESEAGEKNVNVAVLEEEVVSLADSKVLLSVAQDATAIVLADPKKSETLILQVEEVEPSRYTDILPQEHDVQLAVEKAMASFTECTEIASPFSIVEARLDENAAQHTELNKSVSTDVAHPDVLKAEVVQHPEFTETVYTNVAQIISLKEKAVASIEYSQNMSPNDRGLPLRLEANLVQHIDCSENATLDPSDEISLFQEKAFQPAEATNLVFANCLVGSGINEKEVVHPTPCSEIFSADKDALTTIRDKALKFTKSTEIILEDEGPGTSVLGEKQPHAAEIKEILSANKGTHYVIEKGAPSSKQLKDIDTADGVVHHVIETAAQACKFNKVGTKEELHKPFAAHVEGFHLQENSNISSTAVGNALILEKDDQPDNLQEPLTAEQCPQTFFLEKDNPAQLTDMDLVTKVVHVDIFEPNVTFHAAIPLGVPKDDLTAAIKETVQSTECNTIILADGVAQNELRNNHSSRKSFCMPAVDVAISLKDLSLPSYEEDSIVVGMLLNSCVESTPPQLRAENLCEITFSQSLDREPGVDYLQKAKEMDFVKREAEAIEQMAVRIVSQVILAATKEILSHAVVDLSGIGCHVFDNQVGSLELENGIALPGSTSGGENAKSQTLEFSLLAKENPGDDASNVRTSEKLTLSSLNQDTLKEDSQKSGDHDHHEPNVNVVSTLGEFFEETSMAAEDSGCSACTSEDGLIVEDPMQSTGLTNTVSAASNFDILNTSGIADTCTELIVASAETGIASKLQDHKDVRWSTESEADHSEGSDVNSVDSGCAPRKTASHRESKLGLQSKKSDLTIWEIEVPKHLVGRLIGKQGRCVTFLKQTSGADIYISTLPFTKDYQICHIEGSQPQIDKALDQIGKKFKELNLTNIYAPPPLRLPSLPMTSWLMLPYGVTVEVIVVNVVNAGHMFVQQHTHPTFHALCSLDQQMLLCYSQPGIPVLPTPVEAGVICAAPGSDTAWWRAQVVSFYKESNEVEIRYVDYGGYDRVKVDILRQIRTDFVTLPFQGSEVLLDNVIPLPEEDHFSSEADMTVNEMTGGTALLAQVTNYDGATGLPLIQLWSMLGEEVVSINRALVERGCAQWIDGY